MENELLKTHEGQQDDLSDEDSESVSSDASNEQQEDSAIESFNEFIQEEDVNRELEQLQMRSSTDSEAEADQIDLEVNENKTHRPHRDAFIQKESLESDSDSEKQVLPTLDKEEIKRRVQKSFKKPNASKSRNFTKGRGKRNAREQVKSGAGGFWA